MHLCIVAILYRCIQNFIDNWHPIAHNIHWVPLGNISRIDNACPRKENSPDCYITVSYCVLCSVLEKHCFVAITLFQSILDKVRFKLWQKYPKSKSVGWSTAGPNVDCRRSKLSRVVQGLKILKMRIRRYILVNPQPRPANWSRQGKRKRQQVDCSPSLGKTSCQLTQPCKTKNSTGNKKPGVGNPIGCSSWPTVLSHIAQW